MCALAMPKIIFRYCWPRHLLTPMALRVKAAMLGRGHFMNPISCPAKKFNTSTYMGNISKRKTMNNYLIEYATTHRLVINSVVGVDKSFVGIAKIKCLIAVTVANFWALVKAWVFPGRVMADCRVAIELCLPRLALQLQLMRSTVHSKRRLLPRAGMKFSNARTPFPGDLIKRLVEWLHTKVGTLERELGTSIWKFRKTNHPKWSEVKTLRTYEITTGQTVSVTESHGFRGGEHSRGVQHDRLVTHDILTGQFVDKFLRCCFIDRRADQKHIDTTPRIITGCMQFGQKFDSSPDQLYGVIPENKLLNYLYYFCRRLHIPWQDDWYNNTELWNIIDSDHCRLLPIHCIHPLQHTYSRTRPRTPCAKMPAMQECVSTKTYTKNIRRLMAKFIEENTDLAEFSEDCAQLSSHSGRYWFVYNRFRKAALAKQGGNPRLMETLTLEMRWKPGDMDLLYGTFQKRQFGSLLQIFMRSLPDFALTVLITFSRW